MALTVLPLGFPSAMKMISETALGATADNNVADGGATVYAVVVDASAAGAATYVKLWNNVAPVVGTTDPEMVLMVPTGGRKQFLFTVGSAFSTGVSMAALTTGGTAGVTPPSGSVIVDVVTR